jgi:uncharacterized protein YdaU (DUF1376 family)
MNYYPHHIGDFNSATRHLNRLERSIYRDLIELYYDTEQMLSLDSLTVCRKILANTQEEATVVEQTLNEFFKKTENGWFHDRCDQEIFKYKSNTTQKALAGKASAAKRATAVQQAINARSTNVEIPLNKRATNQEPKPEPITNSQIRERDMPTPQSANSKAKRLTGSRLPPDWGLSAVDFQYCIQTRPELNPKDVFENFRDYWTAKAGDGATKVDWSATWRTWVRKEKSPPKTTDVGFGEETVQQSMRREHIMGIGGGGTVWDKKIASAQIFSDLIDITPEVVQNVISQSSH